MQANGYPVYIVEDDQSVRDSLGLLLGMEGLQVTLFADAESFLKAYRPHWCGCLLIDRTGGQERDSDRRVCQDGSRERGEVSGRSDARGGALAPAADRSLSAV